MRECITHSHACDCREAHFKRIESYARAFRDCLVHALDFGQFTENGSTQRWARDLIKEFDAGESREGDA